MNLIVFLYLNGKYIENTMGKYLIKIFKEDLLNFFEINAAGIILEKMLVTTIGMIMIKAKTGGQDMMIMVIV